MGQVLTGFYHQSHYEGCIFDQTLSRVSQASRSHLFFIFLSLSISFLLIFFSFVCFSLIVISFSPFLILSLSVLFSFLPSLCLNDVIGLWSVCERGVCVASFYLKYILRRNHFMTTKRIRILLLLPSLIILQDKNESLDKYVYRWMQKNRYTVKHKYWDS